ncbi:unnamed protein product [Phytophthora lilii]|uniref:Unnamed protein product n=1 Tax=Phytophthora lilii TaxID=2077276 RepID=A0A9W7CP97_9STRA|nr:unnamed protein product [Phytophthora lilii]
MSCFPVWSALLPFAALMALRCPRVVLQVLKEHRHGERVNCQFAQVTGLWRLVEEMNTGDRDKRPAVTEVTIGLLRFAAGTVLGDVAAAKKAADTHLEDQLLEKFFTGLQDFAFKSGQANAVLKPALFGALQQVMTIPEGVEIDAVPERVGMFAAVGSMFIKDLAAYFVALLIKRISDIADTRHEVRDPLLAFLVGLCSHLDLVPITPVLELLELLVTLYRAIPQNAEDPPALRQQRLKLVFYILYVAVHRCETVDSLRQEVGSDAAATMESLTQFQLRFCSEITYEDFYVAAPVHWTTRVWKHWVFLSDDEAAAFASEAHENDNDTEEEFKERVAGWKAWETQIGFKLLTLALFTQMKALLKPHLISTAPLTDLSEDAELVVQARKRRRTEEQAENKVDPAQVERSFDVLLLPDVMERVCSFMTAKRLCRMALVCRTFAELSRRASLWRPLYLRVGAAVRQKSVALPPAPVECHHGDNFEHDWRQLYQERWKVLRKLRRAQRRAIEANTRERDDNTNDRDASSPNSATVFVPQICSCCSCDQVLRSATDLAVHREQHDKSTCPEASCRASFTSAYKFKQHLKVHERDDVDVARLKCGFPGCTKSYRSAKRLATHRQKEDHFVET